MKRTPALLAAILVISLVLSVLFAVRVPYGVGLNPDETAHLGYVRLLVENRGLVKFVPPAPGTTLAPGATEPWETHQPPLYYVLCAPVYALSGGDVAAVRLVAAVIQLLTILLAFRAARDLFPSRPELGLGAAAFVAFLPTQAQLSGAVNNDGLTTMFCLAVFWRIGRLVGRGQETRDALLLGVLLGVGLLTKLTVLQLFPAVVVAYALAAHAKKLTFGRAGGLCALALGIALLIASPWLARNTLLYGDPLNLRIFPLTAGPNPATPQTISALLGWGTADYWRFNAVRTFATFWFILPPNALKPDVIRLMVVLIVGLGGLLGALRNGERGGVGGDEKRVLYLAFATVALLIPFFVRFNQQFFQAQGRYFLPALLPIALIVLAGWGSLVEGGRRPVAVTVIALILLVLCVFQIAQF